MLFVDLALARRLEAAEAQAGVECAATLARLRPESAAAAERIAGGAAVFAGVSSPLTQAMGLGLEGPVVEAEVERLEAFFRSRGDAVRVEVCPFAHATLVELFGRRGYRVAEFSNVLVRPLNRGESWPAAPAELQIEAVGPQDSDLWARTVAQGFAEHFPATPELVEIMTIFCHRPTTKCFLARIKGEPVGGASLSQHEGIAGVYGASTLPAFRNRGVQTALLHARMAAAAAAGYDLAMTSALPGSASQRNIERQDFRVVYTRSKFIREWA